MARQARETQHRKTKCVVSIFIFLDLRYFPWGFIPSNRAQDGSDDKAPVMASATPTAGLRAEVLDDEIATRSSATRALPKPCLRRSTLGVPPRAWLRQGACSAADRKSTRLNSSHGYSSYAVFCL